MKSGRGNLRRLRTRTDHKNGKGTQNKHHRAAAAIAATGLATGLISAHAQFAAAATGPDTWAASPASSYWSNGANWGGTNTPPQSGDSLVFATSSTTALTDDLMTPASYTLAGITFNSGASTFTINPNSAGTNGFTLAGSLSNNSTATQTINELITLAGSEGVSCNTGAVVLGGAIGDGGGGYGIIKSGTGNLTLGGTDTYFGATTNNNGNLLFSATGSAANSAITIGSPGSGNATYLNLTTPASGATTISSSLTFNGSFANGQNYDNLNVTGTAATGNVVENFGALTLNSGAVFGSIAADASANVQLDFTSLTRNPGGILYLGRSTTAIGGSSIASTTANTVNIVFSTAPTLSGSGGTVGSPYISILPYVDVGGGNFATYDSTYGLRGLASNERANLASGLSTSGGAAGQNANTEAVTLNANTTVNSLEGGGAVSFNADSTVLTVSSGGIIASTNTTFGSGIAGTNGQIALGAEGIFIAENSRTLTINSAITGSNGATFVLDNYNGSGAKIILNGTDTYSGITTIEANQSSVTFDLTNSLALQNTTLNYNSFGVGLTFGNGGATGQTAYTFGGLKGSQSINLNNNDSAVGAVALTIGSTGDADTASTVNTYSGVLSNTVAGGSIIKNGPAEEIFTAANTYSGGTTLEAGELGIGNAAAIGSGIFTIAGGSFDNTSSAAITLSNNNIQAWNGDFTFVGTQNLNMGSGAVALGSNRQVTVSANTLSVGGVIGDGGSGYTLTKAGSGTLVLTGANTFGGITTISNGTLSVNAVSTSTTPQPLGENAGLNLGGSTTGGTLLYTGGASTLDKNITLGAGNGTIALSSAAGNLTLTGTITGSSSLTINNASPNIVFVEGTNNSNSFTGDFIITAGTVRPGGTTLNPFNSDNTVSIQSGANFNVATSSGITIAGLNDITGATGGSMLGGSANPLLTLAGSGTYGFSGVISINGSGGVTHSGSGTQDLSGVNTYPGPTKISNGTLTVDATSNMSAALADTSSVTVSTGGDLHLLSTVSGGQGSLTVSMINVAAPLTISGSGTQVSLDLGGNVQPVSSFIVGTTNQGSGYFGSSVFFTDNPQYTDANSADDAFFSGDGGLSVAAVPEPTSVSLMGVAGLGLLRRRRRQRRSKEFERS